MAEIILVTTIANKPKIYFDLSRSIDLHKISTAHTNEKVIEGRLSGLIELNEFVTWQALHFGIQQKLTTKITEFSSPVHFKDEQIKGAFKFMKHDHYFEAKGSDTIMKDIFKFQSPFGFIGIIADKLILKKYLTKLLLKRNETIKEYAENGTWKSLIF